MQSVLRVHGYDEIVQRLRTVAPIVRIAHLDEAINTVEFFVHTEDARRPNGLPPRDMPEEFERKIWGRLSKQGRMSFRRVKARVRLVPTVGEPVEFGTGETVEVRGRPSELLLLAYNRKADAKVDLLGDGAAVEALQSARLGL
jgi:uncharacterized protein (TIGR03085 family)